LTLAAVNRMSRAEFAAALGGVFEHSQWVAEAALPAAPFADVAALHGAMVTAVRDATPERWLALIRAHPDLAGRAARDGTMRPHSVAATFPSTLNDAHKTILVPSFSRLSERRRTAALATLLSPFRLRILNGALCAGFSDACMTSPSTCADGRRPRSAKARNRA
jgi:hypothetical protein